MTDVGGSGEVNDWLDFTTYLETVFPGVAKYKAILYDFMKGFLSCFSYFGYAEKEAVINDTLQMLGKQMSVYTGRSTAYPGILPVCIKICNKLSGKCKCVCRRRFAVVRDSYSGDCAKDICLNSEENVSFKITGIDNGLVTMDFAQAKDEESNDYTFDSIPNYTVACKNNKKIGKATVMIELKGNYTGTITKTFKILSKGTSISGKIVATSKGFQVKYKKQKKNIMSELEFIRL